MTRKLAPELFATVVRYTPLVAIDLVIRNSAGQVLLGERMNRPAKGKWFVPGGRIFKDESMVAAFARLTLEELGWEAALAQAHFLGVFEHFYPDNALDEAFSTHYVVLAYQLSVNQEDLTHLPLMQHRSYRWFDVDELLSDEQVHVHTQWYFN